MVFFIDLLQFKYGPGDITLLAGLAAIKVGNPRTGHSCAYLKELIAFLLTQALTFGNENGVCQYFDEWESLT
jgi:hypothetical protein